MIAEYRFVFSEEHLVTSLLRYRQQIWWRKPFYALKWVLALSFLLLFAWSLYQGLLLAAGIFAAIFGALFIGRPVDAWIARKTVS
jgi:CHASE2 domain-containing sensor protein